MAARIRNATFLVYPDSAPENWIEILREQHVPFIVSPLHDKDKDLSELDGDLCLLPKKAHYHVAICCEGVHSLDYFQDLSKLVNGTIAWKIENLRSMLRYFCHMDNPEKYQYNPNDLRAYCGADLSALYKLQGQQLLDAVRNIIQTVREQGIFSFQDLVYYLHDSNQEDWLAIVTQQASIFFSAFMRDRYFLNKAILQKQLEKEIEKDENK